MKYIKKLTGALAVAAYLMIGITVLLTIPMAAGRRPMIVLSGSMAPAFDVGSVVYIKKTSFQEIKKGDIITYGKEGLVSHRVVEKDESQNTVITRGDANTENDPEVRADQIVGKVCDGIYIPYAGYFLSRMRDPAVLLGIVVIIICNMILEQINREGRKDKYEVIHE